MTCFIASPGGRSVWPAVISTAAVLLSGCAFDVGFDDEEACAADYLDGACGETSSLRMVRPDEHSMVSPLAEGARLDVAFARPDDSRPLEIVVATADESVLSVIDLGERVLTMQCVGVGVGELSVEAGGARDDFAIDCRQIARTEVIVNPGEQLLAAWALEIYDEQTFEYVMMPGSTAGAGVQRFDEDDERLHGKRLPDWASTADIAIEPEADNDNRATISVSAEAQPGTYPLVQDLAGATVDVVDAAAIDRVTVVGLILDQRLDIPMNAPPDAPLQVSLRGGTDLFLVFARDDEDRAIIPPPALGLTLTLEPGAEAVVEASPANDTDALYLEPRSLGTVTAELEYAGVSQSIRIQVID